MSESMIKRLEGIIKDRQANPKPDSYTNKLFADGIDRIAQKVGEEGVEVVVAALKQNDTELLGELADLMYHVSVLLVARGLSWDKVESVLEARHVLAKER